MKRRARRLRVAILSMLAISLLAVAVLIDASRQLDTPLVIAPGTTVELPLGGHFGALLSDLYARGMFASVRQRVYLLAWARLHGGASAIKAGEYALEPGLTPRGLLALLIAGKVVLHDWRIIEGWRFAQAFAALQANPDVHHTLSADDASALMHALGRAESNPEGRLFPDTYRFPKNTPDATLLHQALAAMDKVLAQEWAQRASALPYDAPEQALIMASIVEKETGVEAERPQVAGVFVRRLQLGMRLQTDPTVIYGLGTAYDGRLHARDLQTDTPYNTYTREGLPPTPICLPGRAALHAALHPDDSLALYFVSRGDGSHQFSATLEEHDRAVRRYQLGQSP